MGVAPFKPRKLSGELDPRHPLHSIIILIQALQSNRRHTSQYLLRSLSWFSHFFMFLVLTRLVFIIIMV